MKVEHLEVLVEEPSMEAALERLLPKMTSAAFTIHPHQGKADLLAKLEGKLRGYASWLPATYRVLVVVDRDDQACEELKASLRTCFERARVVEGDAARRASGDAWHVVGRIAIEELEAWYFGDWQAVRAAYPKVPAGIPREERYRDPDAIRGGTWEALERILQDAGYFKEGLRKIEAARAIAEHMEPKRNASGSFGHLRSLLGELDRAS